MLSATQSEKQSSKNLHAEQATGLRLIILNQFFYPDHSATSQLMTALAEDLVTAGVAVTALAGRGSYNGNACFAATETYRGVGIVRVWTPNFGKHHLLGRLLDYLTFYLGAGWRLLTLPQHDVVMALTTPPLIGLIAWLVARLRGMRFIALEEDVYPDVAVALGALTARNPLTRLLDLLAQQILLRADRVIVLGDCMRERILAKFSRSAQEASVRERLVVIHNWADGQEIVPLPTAATVKTRFWQACGCPELAGKFVIHFGGNLGLVNDFSTVLEAARQLREHREIVFVFIGEGVRKAELQTYAANYQLQNIVLLPYQARHQLSESLAAGDALLITLGEGLAGLSVPSKTYSSMAAGRPLIFIGDQQSSTARLIKEFACGISLPRDASRELADTLRNWAADKAQVVQLGHRARQVFEAHFDRPHAVRAYLQSLNAVCALPQRQTGNLPMQTALGRWIKRITLRQPVA